nr:hypothetical protein [Tanacetum cinerariifolium]
MSRQGASYFVTFTDYFSRYGYVYLLKHNHEVFETFKVFQKEVENQLRKTIKSLCSDREGEYISQEFLDHLKEHWIIAQHSPPYTPQHNGVSERRNKTLLDMVRSMMSQTTLPKSFWDYALESVARILNMVPTKKVKKTPYEVWSTRTRHAPNQMCLNIEADEYELGDLNELANYKAALSDLEFDKWLKEMIVEMQSMKDNKVWDLVDLPPNGKTVGSKWLFKKKTDMDGAVHTYKARLVVKGFTQNLRIDYEETFSPVADIRAIRILIAITYDYEIWQMDVKTTFLNRYLSKEKILKRYFMENSKCGSIPMQEKLKLSKSQGASTPAKVKRMHNVPYALAVGSIMYVVRCTRPDVTFSQNITSRFQQNPGAVDWKSTKQSIFSTSFTETEYIAASDASKEAVWVKKFIAGLGVVPIIKEPIKMYCDNTGAITIDKEPRITKGARHYRAKVYYLHEVIEYGDVKLEKVHTYDNLAGPFTKSLAFPKHSEHTENIGMLPDSTLYPIAHSVKCDKFSSCHRTFPEAIEKEREPVTYYEAIKDKRWKSAMDSELEALEQNKTWMIEKLPPNKKALGCNETFSSVAKMVIVRVFLAIATDKQWELHQIDVHNAFLHGDLEEVFMKLPPGLHKGNLNYFLGIEVDRAKEEIFLCHQKYALDIISEVGLLGAKPAKIPMEQNHHLGLAQGRLFEDPEQYQSGGDPTRWLYQATQYFAFQSVAPEDQVNVASIHLDAEALSRLKHTTTVAQYQESFEKLSHQVDGLPEDFLMACYIGGLKDEARLEVKMKKPRSLIDAIGEDEETPLTTESIAADYSEPQAEVSFHAITDTIHPQTLRLPDKIKNNDVVVLIDGVGNREKEICPVRVKEPSLIIQGYTISTDFWVLPVAACPVVLGVQWLKTLEVRSHLVQRDGVCFHGDVILLSPTSSLISKVLQHCHASPEGGHFRFHKTLAREDISMDFIEGLPPSNGFTTIMVLVDRYLIQAVEEFLIDRDKLLRDLRSNLLVARDRMKSKADSKRHEEEFSVGDVAYLKLQPYSPAVLSPTGPQPEVVLEERVVKKGKYRPKTEVLVKWKGFPREDATWETKWRFQKAYPDFYLEDKANSSGGD